ncbi:MAG: septum formation initiator family protein [Actinomycetales bacterium]|nr:septum formation initiator family protein [Actinomycetales bacterium]
MTASDTEVRAPSAASRPPEPRRSGGSFTSRALILAVVIGTLLLALAVPVRSWFGQRAQIATLRADVEAAQQRVADLETQKQRWDDPNFVAAEARRRLHFVLPGEIGYVTLGTEQQVLAADGATGPGEPWYSALWGAVRAADSPPPAPSKKPKADGQ